MARLLAKLALVLCLVPCSETAWGQGFRHSPLMGDAVRTAGLQPAWVTRLRVGALGRVASMVLHGPTLFVLSDTAILEAIDAETGRTLWTSQIGKSNHPSVAPAANDKYVAVANGTTLVVLDRASGELVWETNLTGGAPSSGGAMTAERVYIPMLSGALESYKLVRKDVIDRAPVIFFGGGVAEAPPLTSQKSLMWGTTTGSVYVDGLESSVNRVRFVANGPITAGLAYRAPRIFAGCEDGYVYAIDDTSGAKLWQFAAGSPVRQQPVSIDEAVYVVGDGGGLSRLAGDSGLEQWFVPNVRKFLSASKERVYAADISGNLLVLDAARGARLAMLSAEGLDFKFTNTETDRIYLGTSSGLLQCLREVAQVTPISHIPTLKKAEKTGPAKKKPAEEATDAEAKPAEAKADDPFAK